MKTLLKSMAIGLCLIAQSQAMEVESGWKVEKENLLSCPMEIQAFILQISAAACFEEMSYSDSHRQLRLLRESFYDGGTCVVNGSLVKNAMISAYDLHEEDYETCLKFLNGQLIYTPDEGKPIIQSFADLKTPFAGVFNLSKCGEAGKYLSICTGYRKGKNSDNANKVEIWFTPQFLIKREHEKGTITQFKDIMDKGYWKDDARVGIFWTDGAWDNLNWFDYLTTQSLVELSNDNLYKKWRSIPVPIPYCFNFPILSIQISCCFL